MSLPTYPLVRSALGTSHPITLTQVNQPAAWSLEDWSVTVTLRMSGAGWLVHFSRGFLGLIPSEVTARYPDVARVFRSGLVPQASARLSPAPDGSGRMRVLVVLPAPPFVVPVGTVSSPILAQGEILELEPSLTFDSPAQLLVELEAVGREVAARFNGQLLGGATHTPAPLIDALSNQPLAARAFVAGGRVALDISPELRTEEIPALKAPEPVLRRTEPAPDPSPLIDLDEAWLESAEKRR